MSVSEETIPEKEQTGNDPVYKTREEYVKALESWVNQARMWQNISSCFPYYLMFNQYLQTGTSSTNALPNSQHQAFNRAEQLHQQNQHTRRIQTGLNHNEAFEFTIPPIWKRMVAEGVDFFILFIVKLVLILIALEVMDTSDWQFLKDDILSNIADIHLGTEITSGILILEGIHRVIVCVYEVYWLRGAEDVRFGCSTPGKSLLGITVIAATKIRPSENRNNRQTILVYPANDLGLLVAFGRSFVKNFMLAVIFPFCFAFFLFQYNRTGYDIICNTLVVEYDPNPPKRNWLL